MTGFCFLIQYIWGCWIILKFILTTICNHFIAECLCPEDLKPWFSSMTFFTSTNRRHQRGKWNSKKYCSSYFYAYPKSLELDWTLSKFWFHVLLAFLYLYMRFWVPLVLRLVMSMLFLQISRSIGDVYLKKAEFNREPLYQKFRLREPFKKPILSAEPSISVHQLLPHDQFIIFASDGLWEHLTNQEAVDLVQNHPHNVRYLIYD